MPYENGANYSNRCAGNNSLLNYEIKLHVYASQ